MCIRDRYSQLESRMIRFVACMFFPFSAIILLYYDKKYLSKEIRMRNLVLALLLSGCGYGVPSTLSLIHI